MHLSLGEGVRTGRLLNRNLNSTLLYLLSINPQTSAHNITGRSRADTSRCTSEDNITRVKGHDLRDVTQDTRDLVDHEVGRALLLGLAVKLKEELNVVGILDGCLGNDVAHGQESIEALCD